MEEARSLEVRALCIGSRLNLRALERGDTLAVDPLTVRAGTGTAVLFRYGVVVLADQDPIEQARFVDSLAPFVSQPYEDPETETLELHVDPSRAERVDAEGRLGLREASLERLQVVASALAKSTVLAHYEHRVSQVFETVERLAEDLQHGTRSSTRGRELLRQIGNVLVTQAAMVGRVEVGEKPEITWDRPELDRLYERLAFEYELRDRDLALSRKLDLISRTVETWLELLQNRRSLRVEWYIVALIAVEIILVAWDMLRD